MTDAAGSDAVDHAARGRSGRSRLLLAGAVIAGVALAVTIGLVVRAGEPSLDGAATATITADAAAAGIPMSDTHYGLFYEDINHAADGGLYAELVRNRSFEFNRTDNPRYSGMTAWELILRGAASAEATVETDDPLNDVNLHYLRLAIATAGRDGDAVVLRNQGFNTGIVVESGEGYDFSFWARHDGSEPVPAQLAVEDEDGTSVHGTADVTISSGDWQRYDGEFTATGSTTSGRLALSIGGGVADGIALDLDMVSLFPKDTFLGRPGGLRRDLAEKIAALEPGFLRFPGGCLVNAGSFEPFPHRSRVYNWKDTIGPIEERPTNANFWQYNHSYGLGYLEYFQFAEDLGAQPVPVVPVGVNGCGQRHRIDSAEELAPWVQDTLDLIEFANGGLDTEWGARRAELGHPEPFGLDYIGLGNEEYDPRFYVNYPQFAAAIREAHPDIQIISNSGTASGGDVFERSWEFARDQDADLVDEHYYNGPGWFLANTHRYDDYDRDGPLVMVGEYASQGNSFGNALAEAAYLTGLERNADVVRMASYAPLLANVDHVDWTPDLIWFDNHRVYGTTSYHVQRLFGTNRGDTVVPSTLEGDLAPDRGISGAIGLATWNTQVAYDNVKVTASDGTVLFEDDFADGAVAWTPTGPQGTAVGVWEVVDGEYVQSSGAEDARSVAGDTDWSNYTLSVDARKLSGDEGFLVMFGVQDTGNYYWWNLGGWGNTASGIEAAVDGAKATIAGSDHRIETDRTYRIRIEVDGGRITTWLDNQRVHSFTDSGGAVEPLYQVVTRDDDTGDVVLKVVNAQSVPVRTTVDLGEVALADTGTVTTMTAASPADENSLDEPERIVPVEEEVGGLGRSFTYDFPGSSITFIRLRQVDR